MKKISVLFLGLVLAAFTLQAQTADEIIDQYVTAIGGKDKWLKVTSLKIEGQIEVQGVVIPFTMQAVHNKGYRVDAEFQGNKIIDITTTTEGWSQNPLAGKSTLQPLTPEELKDKLDELDIQGEFVDYKAKGSTVEYLGKEEEDGNEYHKVKLTTKNGKETTFFFDPKTHLVYKEETISKAQGQEMKVFAKNLAYQDLDFGIKMAFKVDQMGMMMMVTNKVTVNPTIDESIFTVK